MALRRCFLVPVLACLVALVFAAAMPRRCGAASTTVRPDGPGVLMKKLRLNVLFHGERVAERIRYRIYQGGREVANGELSVADLVELELRKLRIRKAGRYELVLRDDQGRSGEVELDVADTPEGLAVTSDQVVVLDWQAATALPEPPPPSAKWQRLFFSTDRAKASNANTLEKRFGPDRAPEGELTHGIAMVSFPPGHQRGRIERPAWWKFEVSVNPDKHVTLQSLELARPDSFFSKLDHELGNNNGALLITIHGFNVGFGDAVLLGAQFAHDLEIPCAAYLFTWPSRGGLMDYAADEATNEWSRQHFATLLDTLVRLPSVRRVMVVAHSMGARIATAALKQLHDSHRLSDSVRVNELVLAAADLDAPLFVQEWPRLQQSSARTTIYCSSRDVAIFVSRLHHNQARVGDGGAGTLVLDRLDTIDATESQVDFFAHGFFANDNSVMGDIAELLQGKPTAVRCCGRTGAGATCCLQQATKDGRGYWLYRR